MLDSPLLLYFFITLCIVLISGLIFLFVKMMKTDSEYKFSIGIPVLIGIFSISAYCVFLCVRTVQAAIFWDGIYFIGTDWLAMTMMIFTFHYTELKVNRKKITHIFSIFCFIDSVSLLINNFTHHMFVLEPETGFLGSLPVGYLVNVFYFIHYIHLALCYVMVGTTFIVLAISMIKVSEVYKTKYNTVFITYLVVIIANLVSYSFNFAIDFSVIFYGVLAGFISYFSIFFYPKKLITTALRQTQKIMSDAVVYYDVDGNCLFANNAAKRLFDIEEYFEPSVLEDFRKSFLENNTDVNHLVKRNRFLIDDVPHQFEIEYININIKDRLVVKKNGSILIFVDKTEEINHYNREKNLATHDQLTGIYNRVGFLEEVEKNIRKNGVDGRIMVCSNIMDFKIINDIFGQVTGDQILKKQAKLIQQFAHKTTIYGRISDDKFALFVNKTYFSEQIFNYYMEEMQKITASAFYQMRIHVGIYEPHSDEESAQSMYNKTLIAMSSITKEYKKCYAFYDSVLMEKIKEENEIIDNFHKALEDNQFKIFLQPIVEENGEIVGAEVLPRWQDPIKGLLHPKKFVSILEKYGLIYQFDEYVWTEAIKLLHNWKNKGYENTKISVNVSTKDIFYTDIFETFKNLVDKYNVSPSNLQIELSESLLVSDFAKACDIAMKLRNYGFIVAIDDFGRGDSSLNMLKKFEADVLKINADFLSMSNNEERIEIILNAIVELAEELKMEIIPENLESHHQFNKLKKFGFKSFQGHYFYEPMTVASFETKFYH